MTMKRYNPKDWTPIKASTQFTVPGREVHVALAAPGTVSIVVKGKTYPIGAGTLVKAIIEGDDPFQVVASEAGAYFAPPSAVFEDKGVPFTNAEKKPGYSAVESIVRAELHKFRLEQAAVNRERAARFNEMQRQRKDKGLQDEAPEPKPGEKDYVPPAPPPDDPQPDTPSTQ